MPSAPARVEGTDGFHHGLVVIDPIRFEVMLPLIIAYSPTQPGKQNVGTLNLVFLRDGRCPK